MNAAKHCLRVLPLQLLLLMLFVGTVYAESEFLRDGTDRGIAWVSGGIGLSERELLAARFGRDYNLRLEFALPTGSYVAQINVQISRVNGEEVLAVADVGPWLLTKLPPGNYSVQASAQGQQFQSSVTVPASGTRTLVFNRWSDL